MSALGQTFIDQGCCLNALSSAPCAASRIKTHLPSLHSGPLTISPVLPPHLVIFLYPSLPTLCSNQPVYLWFFWPTCFFLLSLFG